MLDDLRLIHFIDVTIECNNNNNRLLRQILVELHNLNNTAFHQLRIQQAILIELRRDEVIPVTAFLPIHQESPMVPLQAGETAKFATSATPDNATLTKAPNWVSSAAFAPVTPNEDDASGLSASVTFADDTPEGATFSLAVSYDGNPDGVVISQSTIFTTATGEGEVVPVTGFAPITQTA